MNIRKGLQRLIGKKDTETGLAVEASRRRAILLRRIYPPDRKADAAGQFGGLPRLPAEIEWPRDIGTGMPMMFMAQIDLERLPTIDPASDLPACGRLLFFVSADGNTWGDDGGTRMGQVVFVPGGDGGTAERRPPDDAPPCFGEDWMYSFGRIDNAADAPRSFDHWPIEARAFDSFCDTALGADTNMSFRKEWTEEASCKNLEAAFAAYGRNAQKRQYQTGHDPLPPEPYPQFWRMIEAAAGEIRFSSQVKLRYKRDNLSDTARPAYAQAFEEAAAWATEARGHDPFEQPSADDRQRFRSWISDLDNRTYLPPGDYSPKRQRDVIILVSGTSLFETIAESLDELIALDPARLRAEMPEAEHFIAWRHAVVIDEMGDRTVVAHQMFGWGAEVQDIVSGRKEDVLLLQLDTDYGIRWMLGDLGVIQFWISRDDLAAHRFDRVVTTFAGH